MLTRVSQASFTGLDVADIMTHLNVSDPNQQAYLAMLIDVAVGYAERYLGMDLRLTTWLLTLDGFPIWASQSWFDQWGNQVSMYPMLGDFSVGRQYQRIQRIDLRRGSVQQVLSIQYYDGSNTLQTLDPSQYCYTTPTFEPGWLEPVEYWQVAYPRPDAVQITFTSGYVINTPPQVLHAIRLLCGIFYSNREAVAYGPDTTNKVSFDIVHLLLDTVKAGRYV